MKLVETNIEGCYLIETPVFKDDRGFFTELYHDSKLDVIHRNWVQDNMSFNVEANVLRGLHFQVRNPQAKLVRCLQGRVLDIVFDMRENSDTYLQTVDVELDLNTGIMVPEGCAHGYLTLEPNSMVLYKVSTFYDPKDEAGIHYRSEEVNTKHKIPEVVTMSRKDIQWLSYSEYLYHSKFGSI